MSEQLTLIEEAFGLTVVEGENLQLTLDGGNGPSGAAGPNTITTSTTAPSLTGYIFGNGTTIAGATAAVSAATANTLVLRTGTGAASLAGLTNTGTLNLATGTTFTYGTGIAAAHRTALGLDQELSALLPRLSSITVSGTTPVISQSLVEQGSLNYGRRAWASGDGGTLLYDGASWLLTQLDPDGTIVYNASKTSGSYEPWKLTGWGLSEGSGQPSFAIDPPVLLPVNASGTIALTSRMDGQPDKLTGGTISGATAFASGATFTYSGTSASDHRIALGLGTTDAVTFGNGTFATGSISTSQPLTLTQTWTNAATTYTGMRVNVTDTASNAASLLMDLQVGGVSKSRVTKSGTLVGGLTGAENPAVISFPASGSYLVGVWSPASYKIQFSMSAEGSTFAAGAYTGMQYEMTGGVLSWGLTSQDIVLRRDAANTLAQRNGTNAQTSRIYNTYTSATNFERLNFRWSGNTAFIGTEKGSGGGTARDLVLETDGTERVRINTAGNLTASGTLAVTGASTLTGGATFGDSTQQAATRIALGAGTTGATLFGAASPAAANAILNIVKIATADDSRIAATYEDDSELFVSLEVGSWLVDLRLLWGIASGANIAYRLQFTGVISTAVPIGHQLLRASISGQPTFNAGYTETVNNSCHGALLLLNVTTAGTFKIDHRNNNSTGTSIRRAGSAIIAKKIA